MSEGKQYEYRYEYLDIDGKDIDEVIKILVDKRQEIYSKNDVKPNSLVVETEYESTCIQLRYQQLENDYELGERLNRDNKLKEYRRREYEKLKKEFENE